MSVIKMIDYSSYRLDFRTFNLFEEQFDYPSEIHGLKHTYRVMVHCLRLGILSGLIKEARLAFFSAYIHDMARKHDGFCTVHGENSAKTKLPLYTTLFQQNGATDSDLATIKYLVTQHSINQEPSDLLASYPALALLKDADALDRIRLGNYNLNPKYLRLDVTHAHINFGKELYYATNNLHQISLSDVVRIAAEIDLQYQ